MFICFGGITFAHRCSSYVGNEMEKGRSETGCGVTVSEKGCGEKRSAWNIYKVASAGE